MPNQLLSDGGRKDFGKKRPQAEEMNPNDGWPQAPCQAIEFKNENFKQTKACLEERTRCSPKRGR